MFMFRQAFVLCIYVRPRTVRKRDYYDLVLQLLRFDCYAIRLFPSND